MMLASRRTRVETSLGVGIDKDSTVEKKIPNASEIPDVIILPKKSKGRKENIPF